MTKPTADNSALAVELALTLPHALWQTFFEASQNAVAQEWQRRREMLRGFVPHMGFTELKSEYRRQRAYVNDVYAPRTMRQICNALLEDGANAQ